MISLARLTLKKGPLNGQSDISHDHGFLFQEFPYLEFSLTNLWIFCY